MRRCDHAGPHGAWLKVPRWADTQMRRHRERANAAQTQSRVLCPCDGKEVMRLRSVAVRFCRNDKYSRVIFDIAILSPLAELLPSQSWPSSSPPSRHFHHVQLHTYWAH